MQGDSLSTRRAEQLPNPTPPNIPQRAKVPPSNRTMFVKITRRMTSIDRYESVY